MGDSGLTLSIVRLDYSIKEEKYLVKIFGQITLQTKPCPVCEKSGRPLSGVTVNHLLREKDKGDTTAEAYYMCMNEGCDIVYYEAEAEGGNCFTREQIKVPIWFKRGASPRYACYCSHVTVEDVLEAVVSKGARTVAEVNRLTGAMKNANCSLNNPLGVCCHGVIQEVIDQGLAQLKTSAD